MKRPTKPTDEGGLLRRTLSLDLVINVLFGAGAVGLVVWGIGRLLKSRETMVLGIWLGYPLIVGGVVLLVVVLPLVVLANMKRRKERGRGGKPSACTGDEDIKTNCGDPTSPAARASEEGVDGDD